jgi:hypothetical protein
MNTKPLWPYKIVVGEFICSLKTGPTSKIILKSVQVYENRGYEILHRRPVLLLSPGDGRTVDLN